MPRRTRPATSPPLVGAAALVLAALSLALGACGGGSASPSGSPAAEGSPVKGGTLVATCQGEPQGLDPAIDWEGQGWAIEHTRMDL